MTRLAATAKGQHFPTPAHLLRAIATLIDAPAGATLYDPCAGTGAAAAALASATGCTAYGNELDQERAAAASGVLAHCTTGPYEAVERDGAAFSAIYFNPPYASGPGNTRLEVAGLASVLPHLASRGLLIAVVPHAVAISDAFVNAVARTCDLRGMRRFPDGDVERFEQVVVWATKRPEGEDGVVTRRAGDARGPLFAHVRGSLWRVEDVLVLGSDPVAAIRLPGARGTPKLRNAMTDVGAWLARAATHGATQSKRFLALTSAGQRGALSEEGFRPVMPLRRGHAAEMLAAGLLDGAEVAWDGARWLVRGGARRATSERVEDVSDDTQKVTTRERYVPQLRLLNLTSGELRTLDSAEEATRDEYERFMLAQVDSLAEVIRERYPAIYVPGETQLSPHADAVLAQVRAPGKLPGIEREGPLPEQMEAMRASVAKLAVDKSLFFIGEMGVGKTLIGSAIAAACQASRVLAGRARIVVTAPAHLAPKWKREIEKVLGAFGFRAVIADGVASVDAAFARAGNCAVILTRETAKMGARWRHAGVCTYTRVLTTEWAGGESNDVWRTSPAVRCPQCGTMQTASGEADDALAEWSATGDDVRTPRFDERRTCATCRTPLWAVVPYKTGRIGRIGALAHRASPYDAGLAYGGGKVALAGYISTRYRNVYVLIDDEIHEAKAADTDQGYALQDLISGARSVIGLTGTIYGGRASSLFYLAYRLCWRWREAFGFDEAAAFAHAYGCMEYIEVRKRASTTSAYGYERVDSTRMKEAPGAQPAMIAKLLPECVFLEMADLGVWLPPYREWEYFASLPAEAAGPMLRLAGFADQAKKEARKGKPSALSQFMHAALGWPFAMDQDEALEGEQCAVAFNGLTMPPEGFPLDAAIVRFAQVAWSQGHRTLIYVQQTQKRDPSARLARLLGAAGLRTAIMRPSVKPQEREAWVKREVARGAAALVVNPHLVRVGLDLLEFPKIIVMGPDFSVYRLRQAVKRSHRLGGVEPVDVIFAGYRGTAAQPGYALTAKKLRAAAHVDGRQAEGLAASAADEDDGLLTALLRAVLAGTLQRECATGFEAYPMPDAGAVAAALAAHPARTDRAPRPEAAAEGWRDRVATQGDLFAGLG